MKEITAATFNKQDYLLYIDTPFCGTCHVARAFLLQIEAAHEQTLFYQMNALYYPAFMQAHEITSVPCLLVMTDQRVEAKLYTFHSVPHIYTYILTYRPAYFA